MTGRVLVLGGGGFVGRAVMAALGDNAVAASRRPVPGMAHVLCDAADRASLAAACAGASAVVNAAAGSPASMLRATENLCAVAGQGGQPIVHLSSMAVYGAAEGLVREDARLDGASSAYAAGKIACEAALRRFETSGGAVSILRPGIVYGPGDQQWIGRLCRLLRAGRLGDLGAAGDGFCNLVHVRDVAAACLACLHAPGGTFNLAARTPAALERGVVDPGPGDRGGAAAPHRPPAPGAGTSCARSPAGDRQACRVPGRFGAGPPAGAPAALAAGAVRPPDTSRSRARRRLGFSRSDDGPGLAEAAAWFTAQA